MDVLSTDFSCVMNNRFFHIPGSKLNGFGWPIES